MSITATALRELLARTLAALPAHADELRRLDAALGDGDLGITVASGSAAVAKAVQALPAEASIGDVLAAAGKAFATANPSTFAALIGGGLLGASKAMAGRDALGRAEAAQIGRAVAARIAERGKSKLGDKTVLDALLPSLDVLDAAGDAAPLAQMIEAAQAQVEATAALQSQKGRAAWVQERSIGHADPGATAYLRFLQELQAALQA